MSYVLWTYVLYLCGSVALTIWVAHTLHKNGSVFLVDAFGGNQALADSVNRLLVVGFYLVNAGFVARALRETQRPGDAAAAVELLSTKLGTVLLVLGAMHFLNLYVFSQMRRRAVRYTPPYLDRRTPPARTSSGTSS